MSGPPHAGVLWEALTAVKVGSVTKVVGASAPSRRRANRSDLSAEEYRSASVQKLTAQAPKQQEGLCSQLLKMTLTGEQAIKEPWPVVATHQH